MTELHRHDLRHSDGRRAGHLAALVLDATRKEKLGAKFSNHGEVLTKRGIERALTNTLLMVVGQVVTSVLSGNAFSRRPRVTGPNVGH